MIYVGLRNLCRDRMRLAIAICGVGFAVLLVTVEVGMLLGLARNASLLIDRSSADIWVTNVDVKTFDFAVPMDTRKKYLVQAVAGVDCVEEYNVGYSMWKLPDGGVVNIQVVGSEGRSLLAAEVDVCEGRFEDLHNRDAVIIDMDDAAKLGHPRVGDTFEVLGNRARVVGFTRNMKSFTTTPYIFTSLKRCEKYGWLTTQGKTMFFLVKVKSGFGIENVRKAIESAVPNLEAHTRESFSYRTRKYWLLETGVGIGFLAAAALGALVGGVIVSQTLYAMTVEKLPEFGVLRAIGASSGELSLVVLVQALVCWCLGLVLGFAASIGVRHLAAAMGTTMLMPFALVAGVVLLTTALCSAASLMSIARLRRVEPASVFRT